ncbi:MAG: hypothetical protein HYS43_02155 [Candidatus Liptonbacteria bacterium]|nr:hypothetical protein [Candidatus Liptonbacteria bacterium]
MVITPIEPGSFRLQSGTFSILVNPPANSRMKGDITIRTSVPLEETGGAADGGVIVGAGEYEVQGVRISGYNTPPTPPAGGGKVSDSIHSSYIVEIEQMRIGILDGTPDFPKDEDVVEQLTETDILIVPTPTERVIRRLQPRMAILSDGIAAKTVEREMGQMAERADKLTIKYKELPATGPKLVALG